MPHTRDTPSSAPSSSAPSSSAPSSSAPSSSAPSSSAPSSAPPAAPSFGQALLFWLKLGCISFGGPAGQIAIMHQELVERRRWISERRFLHALNYCMVLPGPEAQQLATYLGWLLHRTAGAVVAGGLFVLPSLMLLILLSWLYLAHGQHPVLAGLFYGIKPAVVAIVLQACQRIGRRTLKNRALIGLAVASFLALFVFNLPFPLIVAGAAAIGWFGGRYWPHLFRAGAAHGAAKSYGAALIDDHSPTPPHARFGWGRLLRVLLAGALLWALPLGGLLGLVGWHHPYTQMAWFFTKAALLTFGGAYAVLPYVYQGAVQQFGWLHAGQMIDGLALGESTPGPLIMVVAFVGFLGGYQQALLGPEHLFAAGALAAVLVSWFTFLPSFIFILAGGPLVEASHNTIGITAPLTAISAAVVGVILHLALFFAWHVLWPQGASGSSLAAWWAGLDGRAALLALLAGVALLVWQRGVLQVLFGCALAGWLLRWLG